MEANPLTKSGLRRVPTVPGPFPEAPARRSAVGASAPGVIPESAASRDVSVLVPPRSAAISGCGHPVLSERVRPRIRQAFLLFPIAQRRTPRRPRRQLLPLRDSGELMGGCRLFVVSKGPGRQRQVECSSANSITWPALASQIRSVASVVLHAGTPRWIRRSIFRRSVLPELFPPTVSSKSSDTI